MSPEAKKRRQSLKVLISEAIMVITVALTVIILALLVSGYWLNSDLKVERQGMLQVSSTPTGANVLIDNESSWLQRTNTSKVLPAGEHTISLTKEGYDSWSKTISISEGLLYRLHYPRLFYKERTPENYLNVKNVSYATVSPDRDSILLIDDTTKWSLVRLTDDKPSSREVDVSDIIPNPNTESSTSFASTIQTSDWSRDDSHVLFKTQDNDATEWVLVDVLNPSKSLNLTREFSGNFSEIKILDNSASNLLAVQNGNLHKIDTSSRSMSAVIVEGIGSFDHFENEIVFVASSPAATSPDTDATTTSTETDSDIKTKPTPYYIGSIRIGDSKITKLLPLSSPANVVISKFYDDKYLTLQDGGQVVMYKKDDLTLYAEYSIEFEPDNITVGHDGEFILMSSDTQIATIDMEANDLIDWSVSGKTFGWLDNNMIYSVSDGELIVYDYDGLNRRSLSENVSESFPVTITGDKWLYYFTDHSLIREWIIEH